MSADIKPVAFIAAALDDYGLTPAQFRVFCRIARRTKCWESIPNIARGCKLNPKTVAGALRVLYERGLILKENRPGQTHIYQIEHDHMEWYPPGVPIGHLGI